MKRVTLVLTLFVVLLCGWLLLRRFGPLTKPPPTMSAAIDSTVMLDKPGKRSKNILIVYKRVANKEGE
jgi:hypothetical protein